MFVVLSLSNAFQETLQLIDDQDENFPLLHSSQDQFGEGCADGAAEIFLARSTSAGARDYRCSRAAFHRDESFALQVAVCGGDGVEIDAQVGCHLSDCGQWLALAKLAARNERFDAVGDLAVDRPAVMEVDGQEHCMVYVYSIQFARVKRFFSAADERGSGLETRVRN